MKRIYSLYAAGIALALTGVVLFLAPPRTVYACTGTARCQYGESVVIPIGATTCNCTDNVGCSWTKDGKSYSQKCASKNGDDDEVILE